MSNKKEMHRKYLVKNRQQNSSLDFLKKKIFKSYFQHNLIKTYVGLGCVFAQSSHNAVNVTNFLLLMTQNKSSICVKISGQRIYP